MLLFFYQNSDQATIHRAVNQAQAMLRSLDPTLASSLLSSVAIQFSFSILWGWNQSGFTTAALFRALNSGGMD